MEAESRYEMQNTRSRVRDAGYEMESIRI